MFLSKVFSTFMHTTSFNCTTCLSCSYIKLLHDFYKVTEENKGEPEVRLAICVIPKQPFPHSRFIKCWWDQIRNFKLLLKIGITTFRQLVKKKKKIASVAVELVSLLCILHQHRLPNIKFYLKSHNTETKLDGCTQRKVCSVRPISETNHS